LEIIVAVTAEEGQVAAGFEAVLAVTVLETGKALETSEILFLRLVEDVREEALPFSLLFLLVIRVKVTSSVSGTSTAIFISTKGVRTGVEL